MVSKLLNNFRMRTCNGKFVKNTVVYLFVAFFAKRAPKFPISLHALLLSTKPKIDKSTFSANFDVRKNTSTFIEFEVLRRVLWVPNLIKSSM